MKIRTRLQLITLATVAIAATVAAIVIAENRQAAQERAQIGSTQAMLESLFRLRGRTFEFLEQPNARAAAQWHAEQKDIDQRLQGLVLMVPAEKAVAAALRQDMERAGIAFDQMVGLGAEKMEGREILSGQLQLKIQSVASGVLQLEDAMRLRISTSLQRTTYLISVLMVLFVAAIYVALSLLGRSVLRPLEALRKGTEIVGAGNLEYRLGLGTRDELGELSRSFERMEVQLRERMKELQAFYDLSELAERRDLSLEGLYQELVTRLPKSLQYPEIACARISVEESEFRTDNFRVSEWMQEAPIKVQGVAIGKIELGYLEPRPEQLQEPFLEEEKRLLDAVAERVGHITELRRAERELRTTSQYARSLIEASLDPLVTISAEGKITDVNEATIRATGTKRESLIGSDFSNYFTEPDRARAGYREVFAKGFVTDYPLALRHVSGKVTDVLYNASVYRNEKGEVAGVFAAARDITERKRVEEELRAASLYARSLIEASLDPLVTISADGKITDVNDATVRATGATREALIGSDFSEYFTEPEKARAGYREAFAKGLVTDYPLALKHRSGWVMDVVYNASVYRNEKGEVVGVFAMARDVTKLRKTEQELRSASLYARSLIESSLDPLVTISADGKITDVNEATVEATGVPRRLLIGSDFSNYFSEPDKARAGYQEVFAKGFVTDYPLALRHASGAVMEVLYNASVYRNEQGEAAGVFAAARDITERKKAEEELRKYREHLEDLVRDRTSELEAANNDLEELVYSIAHDLGIPLRAINGYSHILRTESWDKLDDEGKRCLNMVGDNSIKMATLIEGILAFSHSRSARMEMSETNMEELAHAAFDELKPAVAGRTLELDIKPLPSVRGDRALLRQVWRNLLANAIKFTRSRTPALVEVGGHSEGKEHIYYVKDNGAGFDMRYADKLFSVFRRLHGVEEFEGPGIGLAIVKRIITRHGGRVWAEGKVDEGATFYFALPRQGERT